MRDPIVLCICPAHARPDFVQRAVRSFRSQTYNWRMMLIWDSGSNEEYRPSTNDVYVYGRGKNSLSVGALRNEANTFSTLEPRELSSEIIAHFDYDDWSAPERLQYQLDFMRSTGAPVVGFYDMLFMDTVRDRVLYYDSRLKNYGLGTSLFYKREAWERVKFPDCTPEDTTWQHQVGHDNIRGCSSIVNGKPMMIQVIHGANAAASTSGAIFQQATPGQDKVVRGILKNA